MTFRISGLDIMDNTLTKPSPLPVNKSFIRSALLALFFIAQLMLVTGFSLAQTQDTTPSPRGLKKLSLEELMNLDVTSVAKQPEPYAEAPAAIQVVSSDEIHRSGASSIPEALRLANNLDVAQASSGTWDISARGFNAGLSNKLLVLMDGRTIYTPLYAGMIWNVQDYLMADIDRIEVVSGPGGTLWGANAVNGVINITSKSAQDTQGLYFEGGGGSWLEDFTGARYGGVLDSNIYYRVYGKYFDRGSEVYANGNSANDAWRMGQGGFRIDDEADTKNKITLQGDLYGSSLNIPAGSSQTYNGGNIVGRWSHPISPDSDMSLELYYDWTYWFDPVAASAFGPAGNLIDNLDTYNADFQHHFHIDGSNSIIWGLGYRFTHDVLQNTPVIAFLPATLDHSLYSGFAQDEISLASDWFFTIGSKLEHDDYTGYEVEPSVRLKWDAAPKEMFWAAVSRAVREPSRIDRDVVAPNNATPILAGSSAFVSETLIAYELGYRGEIVPKISTSISTFFNNYDSLRSLTPGSTVVIANNLAGQTWGGELTADYQMQDGWLIHVGYDLLNENIWVKPGASDISNGLEDTSDPANQVFLRSSVDLPGNFDLSPAFRWVDTRSVVSGTTVGMVPSYLELDIRVGWHLDKNVEISVVGQNLLQDHHLEYGFPSATAEQISRSVYGKAVLQL